MKLPRKKCVICGKPLPIDADRRKMYCSKYCASHSKPAIESRRRFKKSPKGKAAEARYRKTEKRYAVLERYRLSEKGRQNQKRYRSTEKGKECYRRISARYRASPKGSEHLAKYSKSEARKESWRKYEHSEQGKKYQKAYYVSPQGKFSHTVCGHRRRARKKINPDDFTWEDWENKLNAYRGICPGYDRKPHRVGRKNLHMDHTPPLSKAPKGFRYKLRDVNPLCKSCNSRKYNRLRLE